MGACPRPSPSAKLRPTHHGPRWNRRPVAAEEPWLGSGACGSRAVGRRLGGCGIARTSRAAVEAPRCGPRRPPVQPGPRGARWALPRRARRPDTPAATGPSPPATPACRPAAHRSTARRPTPTRRWASARRQRRPSASPRPRRSTVALHGEGQVAPLALRISSRIRQSPPEPCWFAGPLVSAPPGPPVRAPRLLPRGRPGPRATGCTR